MDLTVARFDDPSRFSRPPFRRREHARRLARHRGACREYRTDEYQPLVDTLDRGDRQAARLSASPIHHWTASDGVELAWHEMGEGRPVVLLHGLFSDAQINWIKFGHAAEHRRARASA